MSNAPAMPTAAKLASALTMAFVGFITGTRMLVYLQDMSKISYLVIASAVIGAVVGWKIMGPELGRSYKLGLSIGIKAAVICAIGILGFIGFIQAARLMGRGRYGGPMEALTDMISIGIDVGMKVAHLDVALAMVGGGILAGLAGVAVRKRWS